MPEISIIVPVYKVEAYLQTCIDSILAQTFQDFELILVDDGSPDNCPVICDEAARKDPRIRVVHQKNEGVSAARNAGLKIAQGNWLGFVDPDDYVAPEFYETLYSAAKKKNVKGAVCSSIQIDETGKRIEHYTDLNVSDGVRTSQEIWLDQKQKKVWALAYIVVWNKIYRREIFNDLWFPEGRRGEDVFIQTELYGRLGRLACISKPLYYYRIRQESAMQSTPTLKSLDAAWAFENCFRYFYSHGMNEMLEMAESRVFAKLSGVYYRLPPEERHKPEVQKARKMQRELVRILRKEHLLTVRALFRTVLFQAFPGLYGLRVRGAIERMDAEQKQRYSEAR